MYDTYNDADRTVLNVDGSPVDGMVNWDGGPVFNPDPIVSFEPTGEYKYADGNIYDSGPVMDPPVLPEPDPMPPAPIPQAETENAPDKKKSILIIAAIALGAYLLFRRK